MTDERKGAEPEKDEAAVALQKALDIMEGLGLKRTLVVAQAAANILLIGMNFERLPPPRKTRTETPSVEVIVCTDQGNSLSFIGPMNTGTVAYAKKMLGICLKAVQEAERSRPKKPRRG